MKVLSKLTSYRNAFHISIMMWSVLTFLTIGLGSVLAAAPEIYDIKIVEMVGRPGHQGLFSIQGQPIEGANAIVQARLIGAANNVDLLLRDGGGNLLSTIPMIVPPADKVVPGTYFADIVIPKVPFTMSISGDDSTGNSFEGLPSQSSSNTPQTVEVRILPTVFDIPPGFPLYFTVRVTNFGLPDTFKVSLTSDVGGTLQPISKNIQLGTNQTADIQFRYIAPTTLGTGLTYITLTATASSTLPNGTSNQAILKLETPTKPPINLTAWLNSGEQGMLGHDRNRRSPLIVWTCNDQINKQTISLANDVLPIKVTTLPKSKFSDDYSGRDEFSSKPTSCVGSSRLKLEFNAANLIASLVESIGLTSESRLTQVPITAYRTDGTPMIGYIPLVLDKQEKIESDEAKHANK
ncbi:MAG: hypothetical protein WCL60_16450 [Methylococcales bacterium]